jgi:hypothetical protein
MKRIVYVAAEVIGEQEGGNVLTVKLLNGFGTPEELVNRDHARELTDKGTIRARSKR